MSGRVRRLYRDDGSFTIYDHDFQGQGERKKDWCMSTTCELSGGHGVMSIAIGVDRQL